MNGRNKAILFLLGIGILLYALIQGVIIPTNEEKAEQYRLAQEEPLTHDLQSILPYKNPYMGNASNLMQLFAHLPLHQLERSFELESDRLTLNIHYEQSGAQTGMAGLKEKLLYNSLAAFALIGNLQVIQYHFADQTLAASRTEVERVFQEPLAQWLDEERWQKEVQGRWADESFLQESVKAVFGNE